MVGELQKCQRDQLLIYRLLITSYCSGLYQVCTKLAKLWKTFHIEPIMGSRRHVRDIQTGSPLPYTDDIRAYKKEYAEALDAQDPLQSFRNEFIIPSKKDLKRKTLAADEGAYQSLIYK